MSRPILKMMRTKISLLALYVMMIMSLYSTVQAQYCIQVQTYDRFDARLIDSKTKAVLDTFEQSRIEKRGNYYTLRVGMFPSYKDALGTLERLHQSHHDAFIRKCDFDATTIVYPASTTHSTSQSAVTAPPEPLYTPALKPQQASSTQRRSLWEECQKCFAPLYAEEEAEEPIEKPLPTPPSIRSSSRSSSSVSNDDAFWSEVIRQRNSADVSVSSQTTEYPSFDYYYPSQSR